MSKRVDSINMNTGKAFATNEDKTTTTAEGDVVMANAPDFKPTTTAASVQDLETFTHEGKKIYEKRKSNGDVIYFDANGNEVTSRIVDVLFERYVAPPEFNQQGGEKKGELQVREVEYKEHGKERFEDGKKPEYIVERQDYTVGESHQATIPKEHYQLVKFLRGEIKPDVAKALEEKAKEKEGEKKTG